MVYFVCYSNNPINSLMWVNAERKKNGKRILQTNGVKHKEDIINFGEKIMHHAVWYKTKTFELGTTDLFHAKQL